jgi:hypothetical protein
MLDYLMSARNKSRYAISSPNYTPQKAIAATSFIESNGTNLAVLFSPWHGGGLYYKKLTARLLADGYDVLDYTFHPEVLKADVEQVIDSYTYASTIIAADLHKYKKVKEYNNIHLIGTSLGGLPLVMVTAIFRDFTEVTMVAIASSLAKSCWEGIRTANIREAFIAQGITESDLDVRWQVLAPKNYVSYLEGREVNLVISKNDLIIPTKYQIEYWNELAVRVPKLHVSFSRVGHYASILIYCLRGRIT